MIDNVINTNLRLRTETLAIPLSKRLLIVTAITGFGWFFSFPFHILGIGGIFTPLWIPAGIASCLVPPAIAVIIAVLLPTFSTLITGMPTLTPPIFFLVAGELAVYSYVISYCYYIHNVKVHWSVLVGCIVDKILLTLFIAVGYFLDRLPYWLSWKTITKGLPGSLLAIIVVPIVVRWIEKHPPTKIATA